MVANFLVEDQIISRSWSRKLRLKPRQWQAAAGEGARKRQTSLMSGANDE